MSRIIFLGTAGSMAVVTRQLRSSGGIIVQTEDLQFHLDPGPGAMVKAKEYGVNVHHTTAVIVSHHHLNHCNDLNIVLEAMTHGGIEHRGIVLGSKSVLVGDEQNHPFLTRYHQSLAEKIIPLDQNHKVGIELVEINAFKAEHTDPNALGFKLICPRFTLGYSGDAQLTADLITNLQGSDLLILNVPYPSNRGEGKNLDTESALKIVSQVKPRLTIITHFGLEMLKADPLNEAREIQRITSVQTIAAQDGLIISAEGFREYKSPVKGF